MSNLDFSNLCRVCLTRTAEMIPLVSSFNAIFDPENKTNLIITDVITNVLNFSVSYRSYIFFIIYKIFILAYPSGKTSPIYMYNVLRCSQNGS